MPPEGARGESEGGLSRLPSAGPPVTMGQISNVGLRAPIGGNNEADPARRRIGLIVLLSQTTRAREDSNL